MSNFVFLPGALHISVYIRFSMSVVLRDHNYLSLTLQSIDDCSIQDEDLQKELNCFENLTVMEIFITMVFFCREGFLSPWQQLSLRSRQRSSCC